MVAYGMKRTRMRPVSISVNMPAVPRLAKPRLRRLDRKSKRICNKIARRLEPAHDLECERLKGIVPTVANVNDVDEVTVIKEAIRHINRLEEAVMQRLTMTKPQLKLWSTQTRLESPTFTPNRLQEPVDRYSLLRHCLASAQTSSNTSPESEQPNSKPDGLDSAGRTPYRTDDEQDESEGTYNANWMG